MLATVRKMSKSGPTLPTLRRPSRTILAGRIGPADPLRCSKSKKKIGWLSLGRHPKSNEQSSDDRLRITCRPPLPPLRSLD